MTAYPDNYLTLSTQDNHIARYQTQYNETEIFSHGLWAMNVAEHNGKCVDAFALMGTVEELVCVVTIQEGLQNI